MRSKWTAAPTWLKVLCLVGAVWVLGLTALAIALMFRPGPSLLLFFVAGAGIGPWLVLRLRDTGAEGDPTGHGSIQAHSVGGAPSDRLPALSPAPCEYASFRHRLVATMWDVLLCWPALLGMLLAAVLLSIGVTRVEAGLSEGSVLIGAAILTFALAQLIGLWLHIRNYVLDQGRTGYTYGKRKVGIRLVGETDGQPAGPRKALAKYLIRGVFTWLDVLLVLVDARRRCLGDMAVSTVVIVRPAR